MSVSQRILKNAFFSYGRTLVAAILGLLGSRWVLKALGASDFGLYGLVGGLLILVTFISAILSQGVSRFLAYAIGENVKGGVKEWFNVALNIYFLLPFAIIPLGWIIGCYFINNVLEIDSGRIVASFWVLRFSLITVLFSLVAMPFQGILTAYQFIHLTSLISLLHSFGQFIIAFMIAYLPNDLLIWYSALITGSYSFMSVVTIVVACRICPDARLAFESWWCKDKLKKLLSYSSLLIIGTSGTVIRGQFINVALNRFVGTAANAGHTVANTLSGQMQTLAQSFLMAVAPEVIRRAGTGNQTYMLAMAQRASKLGMLLILIVALPLYFECETVLRLWLVDPPSFSVPFTKIVVIAAILHRLVFGHRMAFQGSGKILGMQISEFICYSLTAIAVWGGIKLTGNVVSGMMLFAVLQGIHVLVMAIIGQFMFSWSLKDFLVLLVLPSAICFFACWLLYNSVIALLPAVGIRIVLTTFMMVGLTAFVFWYISFSITDRNFCKDIIRKLLSRFNASLYKERS